MPEPGKPGKILLRHVRGSIDAGLRESGAFVFGSAEDTTMCVDGDISMQDLAEFVVEKMTAMGWTFTKRKRGSSNAE